MAQLLISVRSLPDRRFGFDVDDQNLPVAADHSIWPNDVVDLGDRTPKRLLDGEEVVVCKEERFPLAKVADHLLATLDRVRIEVALVAKLQAMVRLLPAV